METTIMGIRIQITLEVAIGPHGIRMDFAFQGLGSHFASRLLSVRHPNQRCHEPLARWPAVQVQARAKDCNRYRRSSARVIPKLPNSKP